MEDLVLAVAETDELNKKDTSTESLKFDMEL